MIAGLYFQIIKKWQTYPAFTQLQRVLATQKVTNLPVLLNLPHYNCVLLKYCSSTKAREFCIESIERYEKEVEEARNAEQGENAEELDEDDIDEDTEAGPSNAKKIKLDEQPSTLSIELKEKSNQTPSQRSR